MFWKKKRASTSVDTLDAKGEFEHLTDELIQETIGPDGEMMRLLNQILEGYSADKNPLSIQDAKNILFSVLMVAVRQRRCLSGRIAASVENGVLFDQYYGKMREINRYTVRANAKLERMRLTWQQYQYQLKIYRSVLGKTYSKVIKDSKEDLSDVMPSDVMPPILDVWEKIYSERGDEDGSEQG